MARFSITLGDVYLLDTGGTKNHWYIALVPFGDESFVFVNISTWYEGSTLNDGTCILKPGGSMPSFIKSKSFIAYEYAKDFTVQRLEQLIAPNSDIPYAKLQPQDLRRIQKESLKSENLAKKYLKAIENHLNKP
jgi:hypothetical protein